MQKKDPKNDNSRGRCDNFCHQYNLLGFACCCKSASGVLIDKAVICLFKYKKRGPTHWLF
jgi:hypothetical protein